MKNTCSARLFEVDCVKAFAVIYMVCIHVYEQLSIYDHANVMPDSPFRIAIEFAGGPLAAPVFMFCMGMGMVYTRHNKPADFYKRGIKLLLTGYALNFFRQTLLQLIGLLLGIESDLDIIGGLLNVDILIFAGMSFLFIGLMKQIRVKVLIMYIIAILLQAVSIWAVNSNIGSMALQCIAGLLLPTGKWVAFPLGMWLVYPVSGMLFAEILRTVSSRSDMYKKVMPVSAAFLVAYSSIIIYSGYDIRCFFALCKDNYYHQSLLSTLWIIPIIIVAICVSYFLVSSFEHTLIGRCIRYCSNNLNRIYIIQWLLIAYSVAAITVTGAGKITSPLLVILAGVLFLAASVKINAIYMMISAKIKVLRMRSFYGFYSNGKYKVGMSGTLWVYDMEDNLLGRFAETPYSYVGAFVPEKDIFVSHTNEAHLVVYDIANMKVLKKIKTCNCDGSEDTGVIISRDGKHLYCIQAHWNDWLKRRLVVYDTENFEIEKEYFSNESIINLKEIEIEDDGICYVLFGERNEESGVIERYFVGIFQDGKIVEKRKLDLKRDNWMDILMYFSWKRSGFTKKTFPLFLKEAGIKYAIPENPCSLKNLFETGHMEC